MDFSSTRWLSELEFAEHNNIHANQMNPFFGDDTLPQYIPSINSNITNYNGSSCDFIVEEKPLKLTKTNHYVRPSPPKRQPSSHILSFETNHSSNYTNSIFSPKEVTSGNRRGNKRAYPLDRSQSQAQEHIIAERRRREKLTQRFAALSALVPGLKKMDKASVLGDAIKHIKCLQERVKEFEDQKKQRTVESIVVVNKSQLILAEESSSSCSDGKSDSLMNSPLPDIEVRVSDKTVMIKIICENRKGHVTKILTEIEKLHLSIINSSVVPFGSTLDITVITRKEREFDMTLVDLAKNLKLALSKFT